MQNINKIINANLSKLNNTNKSFQDIFHIIHECNENVFCEVSEGYKIKKITYEQIKEQSLLFGKYFRTKFSNIEKESFIGLMMDNSPLWVATFWGLLMSGYKPMLLNIRLGNKLNQEIVDLLKIQCVVSDKDYALNCNVLYIDDIDYMSYKNENDEFCWSNEIALSTSATTLNVKVCVYKGEDIANQITNTKYIVKQNKMIKKHYKGELKIMAFLPFYHIFGLIATYFWFSFFGRTLVFLKDFSNETILKTARRHKVTHIFAVPLVWNMISKEIVKEVSIKDEKTKKRFQKGLQISEKLQNICPTLGILITSKLMSEVQNKIFGNSIKFLITGGGYIPQNTMKLINGIGYPLYNGYGMSEIGITSVELRKKIKYRTQGTIGKPLPTIEYKIEDEILHVKGTSICSQIITRENTTNVSHSEWFKTNDIANKDKKGFYYILGRNDDVIISTTGEKINPDLIEKSFNLINAVRYCVLGLEISGTSKMTLVIEVGKNLNVLKIKKIIQEVEEVISQLRNQKYNVEQVFFTSDKIAADTAIKVSRTLLKQKIENNTVKLISFKEFKENSIYDEKHINEQLYNEVKLLFSEVLNKEDKDINPNDHFIFDLGGSSLEYLTLLLKLKEKYEIDFSISGGEYCYTVYEIVNLILNRGK